MSLDNISKQSKGNFLEQPEQKHKKKLKYQNLQLHKQIFELEKQVNEFLTKKQAKQLKNQQLQKQLRLLYGQQIENQEKQIRRLKEQVYYLKSSNAKINVQYINKEQSELLLLIKERNELLREKGLFKSSLQDKKQVLQQKNNGLDEHKIGLENQYNKTKKTNQKYSAQIIQLQRQVRKYHFLAESIKQQQSKIFEDVDIQNAQLQIKQNQNLILQTKKEIKEIEDKWKMSVDSLNAEYFILAAQEKEKRQKLDKLEKEIRIFQHRTNSLRDEVDILNDRSRLAKVKTVSSQFGICLSLQKKSLKESRLLQQSRVKKEKIRSQFLLKELQHIKIKKRSIEQNEKVIDLSFSKNDSMEQKNPFKLKSLTKKHDQKIQFNSKREQTPSNQSELKVYKQKISIKLSPSESTNSNFQSKQIISNKKKSSTSKSLKQQQFQQKFYERESKSKQNLMKKKNPNLKIIKILNDNSPYNDQKNFNKKQKKELDKEDEKKSQRIAKNQQLGSPINLQSKKNLENRKQYCEKSQKSIGSKENITQKKKFRYQKELKQEIQVKQSVEKSSQSKNRKISKKISPTDNIIEKVSEKSVQKFEVKLENKISVNQKSYENNFNSDKKEKQVNYTSQINEAVKNIENQKNSLEVKQEIFKPYLIKRKRQGVNFQTANDESKQKQNLLLLIQKQSIGVGHHSIDTN